MQTDASQPHALPWYERYHYHLVLLLLGAHATVLLLSINFNGISWDEGWNFCVAKNWVLHNHYGCSFDGQFTTPRLSQGPITVAPIALGFKLFGIGVTEGRVFQGIITFFAIIALYYVSRGLGSKTAGIFTLIYLLGLSGDQRIHPDTLGGQGWSETTIVLFSACGLLMLLRLEDNQRSATNTGAKRGQDTALSLICGGFFGIAAVTKPQALPFIACALLLCLAITAWKKEINWSIIFVIVLSSLLGTRELVRALPLPLEKTATTEGNGSSGLAHAIALVFDQDQRIAGLGHLLTEGLIPIIGLGFIALLSIRNRRLPSRAAHVLALLLLICTLWLLWYGGSARPFRRYLGPPLLLCAPIIGLALCLISSLPWPRSAIRKFGAGMLALLGLLNLSLVLKFIAEISPLNRAVLELATELNRNFPSSTVIETYDVQFLFLLNHRYRYPPDDAHLAGIEGAYSKGYFYNPERSPATVFVLGDWSRVVFSPLFEPILRSDSFLCEDRPGGFKVCVRRSQDQAELTPLVNNH